MNTKKNNAFNKQGLIIAISMENTQKNVIPGQEGFPSKKQEDETNETPDRDNDNVENLPKEHDQPDVFPLERENPEISDTEENIPEETPEIENPDAAPLPDIDETIPHTDREKDTQFSTTQQQEKQANKRDEDEKSIANSRHLQGFDSDLK